MRIWKRIMGVLVAMSMLGWFVITSCESRACRDSLVCKGFACVDTVCLTSCKDNGACDAKRGFSCVKEKCICNPEDPSARCHKECYQAAHCDEIKDEQGVVLYPTAKGYTCEMSDAGTGVCTCPAGAQCAQEGGPEEGGTPEAGAPEEADTEQTVTEPTAD